MLKQISTLFLKFFVFLTINNFLFSHSKADNINLIYSIFNSNNPKQNYYQHRDEIFNKLFTKDESEFLFEFLKKSNLSKDYVTLQNVLSDFPINQKCEKIELSKIRKKFSNYDVFHFLHRHFALLGNDEVCLEKEKYYFELTSLTLKPIQFYGTIDELLKLEVPPERALRIAEDLSSQISLQNQNIEKKFYQKKEILIPLTLLAGFLMYSMHDKEIIIEY